MVTCLYKRKLRYWKNVSSQSLNLQNKNIFCLKESYKYEYMYFFYAYDVLYTNKTKFQAFQCYENKCNSNVIQ